jgi:hypothetical protein
MPGKSAIGTEQEANASDVIADPATSKILPPLQTRPNNRPIL